MSQISTKFIANNAVTNAKAAQLPANSIKGNNTGSTGNASDLTISQVTVLLGTTLANGTVPFTGNQSLGSHSLTNVLNPVGAQDAATKSYVDAAVSALNPAASVYAASTANISATYVNGVAGVGATLTVTATGAFTVDGTTPPVLSRILIKNQSSGFQNGIYDLTVAGSIGVSPVLTRSLDYNTASDMNSAGLIPVINGTINALTSWQQTAFITTVGTDALVFQEFTANPSMYLLKANNLSDVGSASASFNNISPMTTLGDMIYENATPSGARLAGNTTATKNFLTQTGTGSISAAPAWSTIAAGDVPTLNQNTTGTASNITASSNSTLTTLSALSLPGAQVTGNISGNAANITASSNSTLTTLSALSLPYSQITGAPAAITALTGDATASGPGSAALTLATVNANVGTFASVTVNAKGLVTAATALSGDATTSGAALTLATVNANTGTFASVTVNAKGLVTAAAALSGDATTSGAALTLATVNANTGTFGSGSSVPVITVNAKGLITAVTTSSVAATAAYNMVSKTTTYAAVINDYISASGSAFTVTLPTAVGVSGQSIVLKKTDSSLTNIITVNTTSAQTIDGSASGVITANTLNELYIFTSDGANWSITDHKTQTAWVSSGATFITATSAYTFTIPSSSITQGTVYTNNGQTFTVTVTTASSTTLTCYGTGSPSASGTLTFVSGSPSGNLAFSASTTTGAPTKGSATITSDRVLWRRSGVNAEIRLEFVLTAAGTATAGSGDYLFQIPSNINIDTTLITTYAGAAVLNNNVIKPTNSVGSAIVFFAGSEDMASGVYVYDKNFFRIGGLVTSSAGGAGTGMVSSGMAALTAAITYTASFSVPITGWQP